MTWIDYLVLAVFLFSVLWGVWRGLVREVLAILGWVIAFLAASLFAGPLGERLAGAIAVPPLRLFVAYVIVFTLALVVVALLARIVSRLVQAAGLGGVDRALGALFGAARGLLLVAALVLLAGLTPLPRQAAWRESLLAPWLAAAATQARPWFPQSFAELLAYD